MQSTNNTTIDDISELSFSDWQKIATACDNGAAWGFFRWIENASSDQLETVSRAEIKQIAELIGYSSVYVADKIDEHC